MALKLGSQTGSLMNHLYSRMTKGEPAPFVGMGATLLYWTDRSAGTIVAIDGNVVTVQEDEAVRVDKNGMSESQSYEFKPNPKGALHYFRKAKSGAWQAVTKNPTTGRWNKGGGTGLRIGERNEYYDFSF